MEDDKRILLKCPICGTIYNYKAPSSPGKYTISCINKECGKKMSFTYRGEKLQNQAEQQQPKPEQKQQTVKQGWQEDGSYIIKCDTDGCGQWIRMTADKIRVGKNSATCPKCGKKHIYEKEGSFEEINAVMLECKTAGCEGKIVIDENYPNQGICNDCDAEYKIEYDENGKIIKVTKKTVLPPSPQGGKMKLVVGNLLGKKEYELKQGTHYIGREDTESYSDFAIKDKFASKRSIKIDVNYDQHGNLMYKMLVERALNPVYHNNREMHVGDIDYLTYGDTIKLGKTLIKVQKIEKPKK